MKKVLLLLRSYVHALSILKGNVSGKIIIGNLLAGRAEFNNLRNFLFSV